jgi:hypothetical protein
VDRELNYVFLEAGEMLVAEMRWDDSWGAAARDLDLLLFDVNDLFALAFSAGVQDGGFGQYPWGPWSTRRDTQECMPWPLNTFPANLQDGSSCERLRIRNWRGIRLAALAVRPSRRITAC